jgi:hypothetical protein
MKTRAVYRLERIEAERPGQAPLEQLLPEMRALIHAHMAPLDRFTLRLASRTLRAQWCASHPHRLVYGLDLCIYLAKHGTPDLFALAMVRWSRSGEELPRLELIKRCIKYRNRDLLNVFEWTQERIGYRLPNESLVLTGFEFPDAYRWIIKHLGRWGDGELLSRFDGMCSVGPTFLLQGLCRGDHYHHLVRMGHLPAKLPRATRRAQKNTDLALEPHVLATLLRRGSRRSLMAIADVVSGIIWSIAWAQYMDYEPRQYALWVLFQGWPHTPSVKEVFDRGVRVLTDSNAEFGHYKKTLVALAHLFHHVTLDHVTEIITSVNQRFWQRFRQSLLRGYPLVDVDDIEVVAVMLVTLLTPEHLTDIMRAVSVPRAAPVIRALITRFRDTRDTDAFHTWLQAYVDRQITPLNCYSWPSQPTLTLTLVPELLDYPIRIDPTRAIHLPTVQDYMSLIRAQRIHTTEHWAYSMGLLLTAHHSRCWDMQVVGPLLEEVWARHGKPRANDPLLLQFIQCMRDQAPPPEYFMWVLRVIFFLEHACGAYPMRCLDYKCTLRPLLEKMSELPENWRTLFLDEVYTKNSTLYWRYHLALLTSHKIEKLAAYDASGSNPEFYTHPRHPITPEAIDGWRTVCYVLDEQTSNVPVNLRLVIFANLIVIQTGQPVPHWLMARIMTESHKRIPLLHPQCCPTDFLKTIKELPRTRTRTKFLAPVIHKFPAIMGTPEDVAWLAKKLLENERQ